MDSFSGIPISEWKLIVYIIISVVILVGLLIAAVLLLHTTLGGTDKKKRERLKKLKEKAETNGIARKRLEKLERKAERERKKNKHSIIYDILVWVLIGGGIITTVVFGTIPTYMDYAVKDYVVYTGDFEIHHVTGYKFSRRTYIVLDDGTQITGTAGLDANATHGTVVYARRSKIALGSQNNTMAH